MKQREIKFRVYDEEAKCVYAVENWEEMCMPNLMQFTGLFDKNGVEIYEGDVVEFSFIDSSTAKEILPVIWDESGAGFVCKNNEHSKGVDMAGNYDSIKGVVIGNIYQNPDLLANEGSKK